MFITQTIKIAAVAFFLFTAASRVSGAAEIRFASDDIAITPPEGFQAFTGNNKNAGILASWMNIEKTRVLLIAIDPDHPMNDPINDQFVIGFERSVVAGGAGEKVWGKFVKVAGIKSYQRLGKNIVSGKLMTALMEAIPANNKGYCVQAILVGGDVSQDPELMAAVDSFRFLSPPRGPANALFGNFGPHEAAALGLMMFTGAMLVILCVMLGRMAKSIWRRIAGV